MTISQVESEFLRTKGKVSEREIIAGVEREIFHLGKNRNKFRIFGYYNEDGYFVIHRIDPKHQYHKVKSPRNRAFFVEKYCNLYGIYTIM